MANPIDELFDDMGDTNVDPNARNYGARIGKGSSILILSKYFAKKTFKKGNGVFADLIVVQSDDPATPPGTKVSLAWFVGKEGMAGTYEKARGTEFLCGLLGLPGTPEGKKAAGQAGKRLTADDQPGRGIMIKANGSANGTFMNYEWTHMPQSAEQIATNRKAVEATMAPTAAYVPPVAAAPAAAPVAAWTPPVAAPPVVAPPAAAPAAASPLAFLLNK